MNAAGAVERHGTTVPARMAVESAVGVSESPLPRVLLIDDDDMLRRVIVRTLRRKYAVTELRDAESAIALLESGSRFDAILCDLNLTGVSGRQFVMHLDAYDQDHCERTIILSGCPRITMDEEFLEVVATRFVEKPATTNEIESKIAELVA